MQGTINRGLPLWYYISSETQKGTIRFGIKLQLETIQFLDCLFFTGQLRREQMWDRNIDVWLKPCFSQNGTAVDFNRAPTCKKESP